MRVYRRPGVLRGEDAMAAKAFLEGQDGYSPGAPRELAGGAGAAGGEEVGRG